MSSLFKQPAQNITMQAPTPLPPPPMPDPFNPASMQAARNAQAQRAGRSSTILTRGAQARTGTNVNPGTIAGGAMAPAYAGTTLGGGR